MALFLAHRGASYLAPENTLVSFHLARSLDAQGFECDIQRCKSGELVLFHDRNLRRIVKAPPSLWKKYPRLAEMSVRDLTWDEISQLDVGSWKDEKFQGEKVSLLKDLLDFVSASTHEFLMIEIKLFGLRSQGLEGAIIDLVNQYPTLRGRLLIASFNALVVWRLKQLHPHFLLGFISEISPAWYRNRQVWLPVLKPDVFIVEFSEPLIPEIKQAKKRGMKVFCWTLDTLEGIEKALDAGADAIISNRPELLAQMQPNLARYFSAPV